MFEFENKISIGRKADDVFRFATDPTNIPKWNYYVVSVVAISNQSGIVGATYHQTRKTDEQDLRIVSLEPNKLFVIETIPPSTPELRREMSFFNEGNATQITDRWKLDMGVPKILEPLAGSRAKNGVKENLLKLKELMENGRVTLQDGRTFSL